MVTRKKEGKTDKTRRKTLSNKQLHSRKKRPDSIRLIEHNASNPLVVSAKLNKKKKTDPIFSALKGLLETRFPFYERYHHKEFKQKYPLADWLNYRKSRLVKTKRYGSVIAKKVNKVLLSSNNSEFNSKLKMALDSVRKTKRKHVGIQKREAKVTEEGFVGKKMMFVHRRYPVLLSNDKDKPQKIRRRVVIRWDIVDSYTSRRLPNFLTGLKKFLGERTFHSLYGDTDIRVKRCKKALTKKKKSFESKKRAFIRATPKRLRWFPYTSKKFVTKERKRLFIAPHRCLIRKIAHDKKPYYFIGRMNKAKNALRWRRRFRKHYIKSNGYMRRYFLQRPGPIMRRFVRIYKHFMPAKRKNPESKFKFFLDSKKPDKRRIPKMPRKLSAEYFSMHKFMYPHWIRLAHRYDSQKKLWKISRRLRKCVNGLTPEKAFLSVQCNLQNMIKNLGFCATLTQAKDFVLKKRFAVNGRICTRFGYHMKPGDLISVVPKFRTYFRRVFIAKLKVQPTNEAFVGFRLPYVEFSQKLMAAMYIPYKFKNRYAKILNMPQLRPMLYYGLGKRRL
jgi:ribosomal protein S4